MKLHKIMALAAVASLLCTGVSMSAPRKAMTERPKHRITLPTPAPAPASASAPTTVVADTTVQTPLTPSQVTAGESIDWQVIAGGGGDASGGVYTVSGTLGQPVVGDIGTTPYVVSQGYWQSFACCIGKRGNVNTLGIIDLSDLSMLVDYIVTLPTPKLPCPEAANVNASGIIDISDLSLLVSYVIEVPPPSLPACP